jgi:hypothetical protein
VSIMGRVSGVGCRVSGSRWPEGCSVKQSAQNGASRAPNAESQCVAGAYLAQNHNGRSPSYPAQNRNAWLEPRVPVTETRLPKPDCLKPDTPDDSISV